MSDHEWALGKQARYEDGRTGTIVDTPSGPETVLCIRFEDDDGTTRELVAATSRFEVIS
jgi:hypothetical protein